MSRFKRRAFILATALWIVAPLAATAQESPTVRRIGYLTLNRTSENGMNWIRGELRKLGYEDGRNIAIDWRHGDGKVENLPALAADLVARKVELIIAPLNDEIAAAMKATRTIPIVMIYGYAPVELGYIASLSHPGGNVTGTNYFDPQTLTRSLQLLKEARPTARRIAVLGNPLFPGARITRKLMDHAAQSLGVRLEYFDATRAEDVSLALARVAASKPDAFFFSRDPALAPKNKEISAFAAKHRLASMGTTAEWTEVGGLLSYYSDPEQIFSRALTFVDRILRGASPADLPVEQPTHFQLEVNLRTAKAIGIAIPQSILLQAGRMIE